MTPNLEWLKSELTEIKASMKEGFAEVKSNLSDVKKEVSEMKVQTAIIENQVKGLSSIQSEDISERKNLEKRVSDLESFKYKLLGAVSVGSVVISAVVSIIVRMFS